MTQHHELRGLLVCGSCGCAMTGAAKMGGRWVGYRCTGRRTAGKPCGPYLRERDAVAAIKAQMHRLTLTDDFVEGVRAEIIREHSEDSDFRRAEASRLGRERSRLETRIDGAYLDALDGRITRAEFDRLASGWRAELERVTRELAALGTATDETMARALRALDLARDVGRLYAVAAGGEDRRGVLMEYVSRVVWADGIATLEFREPYHSMAVGVETLRACPSGKGDGTMLELAAAILAWARAA